MIKLGWFILDNFIREFYSQNNIDLIAHVLQNNSTHLHLHLQTAPSNELTCHS